MYIFLQNSKAFPSPKTSQWNTLGFFLLTLVSCHRHSASQRSKAGEPGLSGLVSWNTETGLPGRSRHSRSLLPLSAPVRPAPVATFRSPFFSFWPVTA